MDWVALKWAGAESEGIMAVVHVGFFEEFGFFVGIGEDEICGTCLGGKFVLPCLKVEFELEVSGINI